MWQGILATIVPVVIGVAFLWNRTGKVLKAMKELGDVLTVIPAALSDQKLSPEETVKIKKEVNEALAALKAIVS